MKNKEYNKELTKNYTINFIAGLIAGSTVWLLTSLTTETVESSSSLHVAWVWGKLLIKFIFMYIFGLVVISYWFGKKMNLKD